MSVRIETISGSTLVEVLVAIVLASLLLGLVLHADLAVNRRVLRWTAQTRLEQAAVILTTRLRSDIIRADSITHVDSVLLRLFVDGEAVEYTIRGGTIERDGHGLLGKKCRTTAMRIEHRVDGSWRRPLDGDHVVRQLQTLNLALTLEDHAAQSVSVPIRPYSKIRVE